MKAQILAALLIGAATSGGAQGFLPYADAGATERGSVIYQDNCAVCHGDKLQGEPNWQTRGEDGLLPAPPHDASGHTWHHPDSLLFRITKFGTEAVVGQGYESKMPGFQGILNDREILEVLAYIKSTWPERVIEIHNARNAP
jgi:mono/diheme cytochrome c family protein